MFVGPGETAGLPDRATLERRLGTNILASRRLQWGFAHRTDLVRTVEDQVAVTWLGPEEAAARVAVERRVREVVGPEVPVPPIVCWELAGPHPFLVTAYVAGRAGGTFLDDAADAARLGTLMGVLLGRFTSLPVQGIAPSPWLADRIPLVEDPLLATAAPEVRRRLATLDWAIAGGPSSVAFIHGDFVPVNALVEGGHVTALLDWEHAGAGHPLADAAWWRAIVLVHHPEVFSAAWGAFREAAGIGDASEELLVALAARRMLRLARSGPAGPEQAAWLERLGRLVVE